MLVARCLLLCCLVAPCLCHGSSRGLGGPEDFPVNPELGVSGFPDCVRRRPALALSMAEAGMDLACAQRRTRSARAVRIACVGDSITAGVHSSGGNHTWPFRLQIALDGRYGWGTYSITNLGACGSTMLRRGDSPYWQRPQYAALLNASWDAVIVMLGTNDAKDGGSGGPPNWPHDCFDGATGAPLLSCSFAQDYMAMIDVVRGLGRRRGGAAAAKSPVAVFVALPPPLMQARAYGMNQTVINDVLGPLARAIAAAKNATGVIDAFGGMGGVPDWRARFPAGGCTLDTAKTWKPCAWWCDAQSCDQCHPNDDGYAQLGATIATGLAPSLPPPPAPTPPPPPTPRDDGAWLYELEGTGKLFLPAANFSANRNSNRSGALGWDGCPGAGGAATFDNGHPIWGGKGPLVGGLRASGALALRWGSGCLFHYNYPSAVVSPPFVAADGMRYGSNFAYLEIAAGE